METAAFLRSLLILFLIMAQPAFPVTFVISSNVSTEERIHPFTNKKLYFRSYYIDFNGVQSNHFKAGEYPLLAEDESLNFEFSGGQSINLDAKISQRILQILRTGHQCITYTPSLYVPHLISSVPPCSYIMYYLKYGFADYPGGFSPDVYQNLMGTDLKSIIGTLQSGDIVSFRNIRNMAQADAFLYLGQNLFLCWDPLYECFYIRSFEHLDEDEIIPNKQVFKVMGIWSTDWIPINELIDIVKIWQKSMAEHKADSNQTGTFPDANLPMTDREKRGLINQESSPSYIN